MGSTPGTGRTVPSSESSPAMAVCSSRELWRMPGRRQDPQGNGQIVAGPFLFDGGGNKVYGYPSIINTIYRCLSLPGY